jgi:hypothetical protein
MFWLLASIDSTGIVVVLYHYQITYLHMLLAVNIGIICRVEIGFSEIGNRAK